MLGFGKKDTDINTSVEIASENDVEFEVKKGWVNPISKHFDEKKRKKEEERRRREEEERRKKQQSLAIMVAMLIISFAMIAIPGLIDKEADDSVNPDAETIFSEETNDIATDLEETNNNDEKQTPEVIEADNNNQVTPKKIYADDIPINANEETDLGFIVVEVRGGNHYKDGSWGFTLPSRDGLQNEWLKVYKLSSDDLAPDLMNLFERSSLEYSDQKDYVYTITGYGTWIPLSEEIYEDYGDFVMQEGKVIDIKYDDLDKALRYN